jgi:hypothetical protein
MEHIRIVPRAIPTVMDIKSLCNRPREFPRAAIIKLNSPIRAFEKAALNVISLFFPYQ